MILLPEFNVTATSNSKGVDSKTWRITTADNTFLSTISGVNLVRAVLPADATVLDVNVYTSAGSNAGTSANLSVGLVLPFLTISAAGTTATVTSQIKHNLVTGDLIVVNGTGQANFDQATPVAITVTGVTTFTYTISSTTATSTIGQIGVTTYWIRQLSVLNGTQVAVAVGASPFAYTAPAIGTVVVAGGTVSAITVTHLGGAPVNIGVVAGPIPVIAGDVVTVTYTVAPTMTFLPAEKSTVGQLPVILQRAGPPAVGLKPNNPLDPSGIPLGSDVQIFGMYQETGTASTVGGPWFITFYYVR